MRVAVAGIVALWVVALAAPARAGVITDAETQDARAVGIVVQGGGSLRRKVQDHLEKRLRREGYTAVSDPLGKDALNTLANCFIIEDLKCARGVVEARARTPRLVFARIDDSTGAIAFDFTWFAHGRDPIAVRASCSECAAHWQDHTDDLVTKLTASAEMPILTEPEPDAEGPLTKRSRFWPTALITAGAATLVTGSLLLYYGLRDGPSHKYVYPSLTPVGITLIAVGGGAVIGGIITW